MNTLNGRISLKKTLDCQTKNIVKYSSIPQIAPIIWLTLFIIFNIILFTFISNIYFINNQQPKKQVKNIISNAKNWTW